MTRCARATGRRRNDEHGFGVAVVDRVGSANSTSAGARRRFTRTPRLGGCPPARTGPAKADGRSLIGPGGLLADLTKQVLESGLEVEMEDHVPYPKHAVEGRNGTGRVVFEAVVPIIYATEPGGSFHVRFTPETSNRYVRSLVGG